MTSTSPSCLPILFKNNDTLRKDGKHILPIEPNSIIVCKLLVRVIIGVASFFSGIHWWGLVHSIWPSQFYSIGYMTCGLIIFSGLVEILVSVKLLTWSC